MSHSDLYGAAVFADSPLAWYRLDETSGTGAADEMGGTAGAHTSVTVNQSPLLHEPFGKSVLYNGTSSRTSTTNLGSFGSNILTGTIEFIAQTSSVSGVKAAVGVVNAAQFYAAVYLNAQGETSSIGSVGFYFRGVNSNVLSGGTATSVAINDGLPHHVAVVVLSSSTFAIYVDGVSKTITYLSQQTPTAENLNFPMMIGARNVRGTADRFFPGTIDEVAFYTSRLSSTRIAAHAAAMRSVPLTATSAGTSTDAGRLTWTPASPPTDLYGPLVLADDPVAWYRMDETSGTSVADSSGGGHTGTNPGGGLVSINQAPLIREPFGRSATYTGAGWTTLDTLDTLGANISNASVEFVMSATTTAGPQAILGAVGSGGTRFLCQLNTSFAAPVSTAETGSLSFSLRNGDASGNLNAATGDIGINDGLTHHVVWVVTSATTMACYVDGVSKSLTYGFAQDISTAPANLTQPMMIGALNSAGTALQPAEVTLDEVAFYNTRLSAGRIQAHSDAAHTVALAATDSGTSLDTAAFGGPVAVASAADSGTSADTADLAVAHPLAATEAGTSADTTDLRYTAALAATDSGTSLDTGGFVGSTAMFATDAGASSDTANLTAIYAVSATDTGASLDTAAFVGTVGLAAADAGTSSETVALRVTYTLAAADAGSSLDTASGIGTAIPLAAVDAGTSLDTGAIIKALLSLAVVDNGIGTTGHATLAPGAGTLPSGTLLPGGIYVIDARVAWALTATSAGTSDATVGVAYPDPTAYPDPGLFPGTSPAQFDLTVAHSLIVADAGTSFDTGNLGGVQSLSAVDAGASFDTAALGASRPVAATDNGTSSDTAALGSVATLAATDAGTSADTGDAVVAHPLASTDAGTSLDTAAVAVMAALTATDSGLSADTADAIVAVSLQATDDGTSFDGGDFAGSAGLIATDAGDSADTADAGVVYAVAVTDDGTSADTAAVSAVVTLAATDNGSSLDTAAFAGANSLAAVDPGTSSDAADLAVAVTLAGGDAGDSATTGQLGVTLTLAATDDGSSTDTTSLAVDIRLAVADIGSSSETGNILLGVGLAAIDDGTSFDTSDFTQGTASMSATSAGTSTDTGGLTLAFALNVTDDGSGDDQAHLDQTLIATVFSGWFEDGLDVTFTEDDEDAEGVTELAIIE